jgi:DNA polymerase III epsilon subunit-like protein
MPHVVIALAETGANPGEGSLYYLGAHRFDAHTGELCARMLTEVRPALEDMEAFASVTNLSLDQVQHGLHDLPTPAEALLEFSRFIGDDLVVALQAQERVIPALSLFCTKHALPMREHEILDLSALAQACLPSSMRRTSHAIGEHLGLWTRESYTFGPAAFLEHLAAIAGRLLELHPEAASGAITRAFFLPGC